MKFKIEFNNKTFGRVGCISNIANFPDREIETPALILYTKAGTIPHITHEVLDMITKEFLCMNYPLANIIHCEDAINKSKHGISKFVGLPEYMSFCLIHDPTCFLRLDCLKQKSIGVWSRNGKIDLKASKYMDIMEAFQPDMYVAAHDENTTLASSSKRCNNSVERTIYLSQQCMSRHRVSKVLSDKAIIGAVGGGGCIHAREKVAKFFGQAAVDGYLINGVFAQGSLLQFESYTKFVKYIKASVNHLSHDKLRIISGCWNPFAVLQFIKLGIDLFDTSLPCDLADKGVILDFPFDYRALTMPAEDIPNDIVNRMEMSNNRTTISDDACLNQFIPLVENCTCLVCKQFTRSYVHHLWITHEMLATVLLSIHNIHYYLEFFKGIRETLKKAYTHNPCS